MAPRIGVSTLVTEAAAWPAWCRRLEEAGVDEISVADHLKPGVLPPLVALAAAAAVTEGVALSTMVVNNELRHPAVLANEVALLAEVSRGRFTLGIGQGMRTTSTTPSACPCRRRLIGSPTSKKRWWPCERSSPARPSRPTAPGCA